MKLISFLVIPALTGLTLGISGISSSVSVPEGVHLTERAALGLTGDEGIADIDIHMVTNVLNRSAGITGASDPASARLLLSGNANAIVLDDQRTFTWQRIDRGRFEVNRRILVLNQEGRDHGIINLFYNEFRTVRSAEAAIYTLSGQRVNRIRTRDFSDIRANTGNMVDSYRVRSGEIFHDQYPYILEISYTIQYNSFITFPSWTPVSGSTALASGSYTVDVPATLPIEHHARNFGDRSMDPEITQRSGNRVHYTWTASAMPARRAAPMSAPADREAPVLQVRSEEFRYAGHNGSTASWQDFGNWVAGLWHGRDQLPEDVKADVRRLTEGLETDYEKIDAIYRFLQQNTRYVSIQLGIGGLQTERADNTYRDRYGDCKALTNYMMAMLSAIGIESYPALIRAGRHVPPIQEDFPSQAFNHVVLFIPMADDTLWVECTSKTSPLGYLGSMNADRTTLVVRGGGKSELIRTPAYSFTENFQHRHGTMELDRDGNLDVRFTTAFGSVQSEHIRHIFTQESPRRQQEFLSAHIDHSGLSIRSTHVQISETLPSAELQVSATLRRYANLTGSRLHFQPNILERSRFRVQPDSARTQPVYFNFPYQDTDSLIYRLPNGFSVEFLPDNQLVETPYTRYEVQYHYDEERHTLLYVRRLEILQDYLPAEMYPELMQFFTAVNRHDNDRLILSRRFD